MLKSEVHATLAGVALAFFIPMKSKSNSDHSPVEELEHVLHPWVSYLILPIFAFANSGISLQNMGIGSLFHPVPLGIMLGLVVGKLLGVYGFSYAAIKLGLAQMPENPNWRHLAGVASLCGIGFTMSLFIGGLAFEHTGGNAMTYLTTHRIGILSGSLISGLLGYVVLCTAQSNSAELVEDVPTTADL